MPFNLSQKHIKRKLRKYLQIYLPHSGLIDKLINGYCAGFTALYLYAIWQHFQPESQAQPAQRDDLQWLLKALARVTDWDERKTLSKQECHEFERLINFIDYYQNGIDHCQPALPGGHFSKLFFDSQGRNAVREYTIAAHFTRGETAQVLSKIVHDDKLIFIHSHNHAVGLLKHGAEYYYIDPNNQTSVLIFKYIELVAACIFDSNDFIHDKPSPLGFEIIGLNTENQLISYPAQRELLKDLKIFQQGYEFFRYINEWKDEKGYNALHQAVNLGCVESVDYILQHLNRFPVGYIEQSANDGGVTPLIMACIMDHTEIAGKLIKAGANIHRRDKNDGAALIYALAAYEHDPSSKLATLLIDAGANVNDIYRKTLTPLLFSLTYQHDVELLKKLCAAGADPTFSLYLYAAQQGSESDNDNEIIIKKLLKLGADKEHALNIAIEKDDAVAVFYLAKHNVDINKLNIEYDMTPLMLAIKRKNHRALLELLRNECRFDTKTSAGKTALMLTADFISFDILMNLGGRPVEGWHNWVVSAQASGLNINAWLLTLLRNYIQYKQGTEHLVSQYVHKLFGDSKPISQARSLLQAVNAGNEVELNITVDELRDFYQIYQTQIADLKRDNRVNSML